MRRALLGACVALTLLASCKADSPRSSSPTTVAGVTTTTDAGEPVRVGVWMPPDPALNTYGGALVRDLVYPQLFRATPAGKLAASLVEPGSDRTAKGAERASFRLRKGAVWSDGTPITAADLRRTMDPRFVAAVDDPTPTGTIRVRFTQRLPGWRRLWSGLEAIVPPRDGLYGGPYRVEKVTSGLETVLVANDTYWGEPPRIRTVHLVLAPDAEIQARLMEQGDLDVIAPLATTARRARLERVKGATVVGGEDAGGGWTASLVANPSKLDATQRQTLFALADGPRFTTVLLNGDAVSAAPRTKAPASPSLGGASPAISSPLESAPAGILLHAMQRAGFKADRRFDLRQADFDVILGAYASGGFDMVLRLEPTPAQRCYTCSFASVDAALAKAADAGDTAAARELRRRLLAEFYELPLWRERPVAAVREGLEGVSVNGFHVGGPTWNLETWEWAD